MANKKLKGTVTVYSNSPGAPTGYGQQTEYLVTRMKRDGLDVGVQSNYGVEGMDTEWDTGYGKIPQFARGYELYSSDVLEENHMNWVKKNKEQPDAIFTLYDTWVLHNAPMENINKIIAWTPLDHATMPAAVYLFLKRKNVVPVAMSPFGLRQMEEQGIKGVYIPHGIDTKVFKPTYEFNGKPTREFFGLPQDAFFVVMNSANKANKSIHRKAFAENLLAFKLFRDKNPNSFLYIHTEPLGIFGGFNLIRLAQAIGLPQESLLFPRPEDYRRGFTKEQLAAIYTAADITLTTSYGEGFGIATIESQACGTPTITSGFAASPDLVGEDSFVVNGQPFWDEAQSAWFTIPMIASIVEALEMALKARTGKKSEKAIEFASQFDFEKIWNEKWIPFLKEQLK